MKKLEATACGRRNTFTRSALSLAVAGGLALAIAPAAMAQAYQETGKVGDPSSWLSDEFLADWGLEAINAHYAYARGLTGNGVRIGVFDTGVALSHGEFAGRGHNGIFIADPGCTNTVVLTGCFASYGDAASIDAYMAPEGYVWRSTGTNVIIEYGSHGTHVAGTMVANRDGIGMHGVSTGATLTSAKLFFNRVEEYYFDSMGRLRRAVHTTGPGEEALVSMYDQMAAQGVRAINHSWGNGAEPRTEAEMDDEFAQYGDYYRIFSDATLRTGMINVWAAGNGYGDIAGAYATLPRYFAEAEAYWLSVVNLSPTGEIDDSSSICGLSMNWCITAPGTGIASSVVGGTIDGRVTRNPDGSLSLDIDAQSPEYGYDYYTGTSMAAPHVTGALALLMERFPYLDNPQIRDVLLTTALDLGEEGVDEIYGWGLMDLRKAIDGPGQIRVDTDVVMNTRAGGAKVWAGDAWDDWANDISGPGRLTKSGIGWLRLSGDNSFNGLTVRGGILELTGSNRLGDTTIDGGVGLVAGSGTLANAVTVNRGGMLVVDGLQTGGMLTVNAGGRLGGSGTVGTTVVGGTTAPGNSIGTLTVNGDYTQQAGSTFEVELDARGRSDLLAVTGSANLLGGNVRVLQQPGTFLLGERYTVLSATGGISGQFAGVDQTGISPFLRFNLMYAPGAVGIDVVRGQALATAARTPNQRAVAASADALAVDQGLPRPLTQLFPEQAPAAFDALSGEVHASAQAVLAEETRHVREAALGRAAFASLAPTSDDDGIGAWAQVTGGGVKLENNGNAARVDSESSSVLVGVDRGFAGGWRVGVFGGAGRSDMQVTDRASTGDVDSRHLGLYAGMHRGSVQLRAGAAHARHDVDTQRVVAFPGFEDRNTAAYRANTTQLFVEGGYRITGDRGAIEPFAQVASVAVDADRFSERGGAAALSGEGDDMRVTLSTIGVRGELGLRASGQDAARLVLSGRLGWRHASGDREAATTVAWSGGAPFTVTGASVANSAAVADVGAAAWLGASSLLELGYGGQFDGETREHGAYLRYSLQF
jgi:subtilase-type serine protease